MEKPEKITKPGRVIGRWLAACRQHLCGPAAGLIASVMLAGDARAQVDAVQIQSAFATPWSKAAYIEAAEAYYARYPDWNGFLARLSVGINFFSFQEVKPCAALYRETGKAKYAQAVRAALLSIATNGDGTYTEMDSTYAYHLVRGSAEFSTADRTTIESHLAARMNLLLTDEQDTTFVRGMMNATALAYAEILLLPGDPGAAAWRTRHETIWNENMLRVMDATEDSSNYGPMWLAAMHEYVRVTAPRSGVTLSAFFNRPEIRNLCERNFRAANSVGFIPSFGGGSTYAVGGQMIGTFEALATIYQDGRYKDAASRMMNFMRTAVDPFWFGSWYEICTIPVFDYADDTLAPVAVTRPSVVAFDRNLQGRAVPDKLMMETGGLASDSSLLVNLAQGYTRGSNGSSAVASFVDQASPLLINGGGDRVSQNVMMVRAGAEAFPYVPAAAGQLGQQYINDNIRRRFTFHIRGSNGNHGSALDPRFLSRLQIYLSGALRDAANNSTFRLHIDNVRAVGASGSLLLNAGQTFFPVEGWNTIGFGGMRDLSDYDTVEFGMRIEQVSPEGALYDILGFLGNDSGSNSFFFPHNFDTSSLSRVLHSQSFARAQFSAIEAELKDTLGGDNIQRRDLLLAPGGILLARDRITFSAAQTEIQVGPVWNAAQVLSSGSRWHDLTQAKQQKLPQRSLLAYFPERTDGDTSFIHGTAQHPSSTNVVAYQKWSGSPAAGSTRTFNTLLLGHDQAQPAAALADTVQTLRCDESATLVKVGGKFLLLNPGGVSINAGGLQTDAEVLYLETSGTAVTHYSGSGASQLVFSGVTIFQGTERQVRFGSTAPVITVPETMTVYTRGNSGRVVNFGVGAADHTDGPLVPVCTPPSGSVFPLGSTTVQCSATNSLGQTSTSSFTVTVVDETVLPASGVTLHLDASNPSSLVLDSNNRVSRWNDADGGANYAAQSSGAQQPTSVVEPTLGSSIVDFGPFVSGSTGHWLEFKDGTGANLNLSSVRSVFVVMKGGNPILGDDNNYHFHRAADYSPPTSPLWSSSYASSNIKNGQTYLNGGAVPIDGTTTSMPSGYWMASVITSGPVEASRLACDRTNSSGGQQIAEVLIYDRVLTDSERQGTEAYLMAKWFSENTPPVLTVPPSMTVEATGANGAVVNFATSAVDHAGGSIATVNSPPSGSTFPIGSTTVTVTATDAEGYSASTTFTVTVQDSIAPSITAPQDITVEATGPAGAVVTFTTSAIDTVSGNCATQNTPASGSTFPVGTTPVTVASSDVAGNNTNTTFTVTVQDSTAPSITVPANITVEATVPAGAVVTFITSAIDTVSGNCTTQNTPASGSTFPVGTTTVNVTASDAANNSAGGSFTVTVNPWNTTPVLGAIGNKSVVQLSTLSFTVSATDSDTPAQSLTYSLDAGAPAGAVIDPSTGAFSWTPSIAQVVGSYPVTVRVADNGTPSKNASETISITVTSSLPLPWANFDIGAVGLTGSASHVGGTFNIAGAGADIGGTADALQYVYQVGSGDCSITAKVGVVENTSSTAIAGVMIRESLAANSKQATALMTPGGSYAKHRSSTGGKTTQTTGSTANRAPYWVRLTRTGNTFRMYRAVNGTTWTQIGSNRNITMAASVYIGIGVCSKVTTTLNDSTFSNVTAVP